VPEATFRHTATTAASRADVLASLESADTWRGIGPIDRVWDEVHDGHSLAGFRWSARAAGRSWEGRARRIAAPEGAMALDLDSPEMAGTITVTAATNGDGTDLEVALMARSKGALAGMFWGVISDALRRGLPDQVEAFAEGL
jgi:hypothetical protein